MLKKQSHKFKEGKYRNKNYRPCKSSIHTFFHHLFNHCGLCTFFVLHKLKGNGEENMHDPCPKEVYNLETYT